MLYNVIFSNIVWDYGDGKLPKLPVTSLRFEKIVASNTQLALKIAIYKCGVDHPDWGIVDCVAVVETENGQTFQLQRSSPNDTILFPALSLGGHLVLVEPDDEIKEILKTAIAESLFSESQVTLMASSLNVAVDDLIKRLMYYVTEPSNKGECIENSYRVVWGCGQNAFGDAWYVGVALDNDTT